MNNVLNEVKKIFPSSDLATYEEILSSFHLLKEDPQIRMFQEAMPEVAVILNQHRQLVYANSELLHFLKISDEAIPIGKRPGEILSCIHSKETINGCGTTDSCKFCGLVNAVFESQQSGKPIVKEARISAGNGQRYRSYDLKIKASPLYFQGNKFTIVSVKDISDKKRLDILQSTHFDEVLNSIGEIKQVVNWVKKNEQDIVNSDLKEVAQKVNFDLIEDLLAKKILKDAEEGRLKVDISRLNSLSLLKEIYDDFAEQTISWQKRLFIDPFSHSVIFISDIYLFKKVLVNIIKNAFEASLPGMTIKMGVRLHDKTVRFWVNSHNEMSSEVSLQVFQRSFSTKGKNRGLGTYEAKLLTSRYLQGKVYFSSNLEGTTFYVEIPLSIS